MLESKTNVGRRDERIIIQQVTYTKDDVNQDVETWSTLATVWASVTDQQGGEGYHSDQLTVRSTTSFDIRFLSTVTEQMRIIRERNSRFYKIVSMVMPDRKRSLILKTELLDET